MRLYLQYVWTGLNKYLCVAWCRHGIGGKRLAKSVY